MKWNKAGDKFCAGTSSKSIIVGNFSKESDFWRGNDIKSHKSAITSVDFDPSGTFVIAGSTDLKFSIHSAYIKEVDDPKEKIEIKFNQKFLRVSPFKH